MTIITIVPIFHFLNIIIFFTALSEKSIIVYQVCIFTQDNNNYFDGIDLPQKKKIYYFGNKLHKEDCSFF